MPVVPINTGFSNISEFVDSLFDPDVRTMGPIQAAISAGNLVAAFSSEVSKIPPVWLAAWQKAQGDPYSETDYGHSKPADQQAFSFLSNYIKQNALSLYVPQLTLVSGPSVMPPVYQLGGYQEVVLVPSGRWDYEAVSDLLGLFLFGGHFVVIQQPGDLPPNGRVADFYQAFRSGSLAAGERHDPGNSHYTSVLNICGYYFPSVSSDTAPPDPAPFILSWLVGLTVSSITCNSSSANAFFQLEGWQASSGRHDADYDTYTQTLWNISTYGACAYSEKRGTALFLAPAGWEPLPNGNTFMPPYVGADPRQPWLNTGVVTLPASAPLAVVRVSNKNGGGPFQLSPPASAASLTWSLQNADNDGISFTVSGNGRTLSNVRNGTQTEVLPAGTGYQIRSPQGATDPGGFFNVVVTRS